MNDIKIQISPLGRIKVWADESCCFPGTVAEKETLKRWIGRQVNLPPERKLAIQGEIDCAVARWQWKHVKTEGAPTTKPAECTEVVDGPGGCFGVALALLLVVPLGCWVFTILWCIRN